MQIYKSREKNYAHPTPPPPLPTLIVWGGALASELTTGKHIFELSKKFMGSPKGLPPPRKIPAGAHGHTSYVMVI